MQWFHCSKPVLSKIPKQQVLPVKSPVTVSRQNSQEREKHAHVAALAFYVAAQQLPHACVADLPPCVPILQLQLRGGLAPFCPCQPHLQS